MTINTDASTKRPQDDTMEELNRRYLHRSPSYELYNSAERDLRPKVRVNDLYKAMSTLQIEIRKSTKGLQHLVFISRCQKPEPGLRRQALLGAWLGKLHNA